MCGIVGLFLKDDSLSPRLGGMLSEMLVTMTDRGPDSAGIALYGASTGSNFKVTVQSDNPAEGFNGLASHLSSVTGSPCSVEEKSTHAVISTDGSNAENLVKHLRENHGELRIMSTGDSMEIYKEVGLPKDVRPTIKHHTSATITDLGFPLCNFAAKWVSEIGERVCP